MSDILYPGAAWRVLPDGSLSIEADGAEILRLHLAPAQARALAKDLLRASGPTLKA